MTGEAIKRLCLLIIAFLAVAGAVACSPERDDPVPDPPVENIPDDPDVPESDINTEEIAGTWHLTRWSDSEPAFEVYISITDDGNLTLWQRIDSYGWEVFGSTVNYEDSIISGVYADGTAWGASYMVVLEDDLMTWTSVYDDSDVSSYTLEELPDDLP